MVLAFHKARGGKIGPTVTAIMTLEEFDDLITDALIARANFCTGIKANPTERRIADVLNISEHERVMTIYKGARERVALQTGGPVNFDHQVKLSRRKRMTDEGTDAR